MDLNAVFSKLDELVGFFVPSDGRANIAILLLLSAFALIAYWYLRFLGSRAGSR